jgi:hypothetical protein
MEALQRVKLDGFQMVISDLEVEQDYLRRAKRQDCQLGCNSFILFASPTGFEPVLSP